LLAAHAQGTLLAKPLLLPVTLELKDAVIDALMDKQALLEQCALYCRRVTPHTVALYKIPVCIDELDVAALLPALSQLQQAEAVLTCLLNHSQAKKEMTQDELQVFLQRLFSITRETLITEKLLRDLTTNDLKKLM
jgi:DNA mismatch repair ATPase MutL